MAAAPTEAARQIVLVAPTETQPPDTPSPTEPPAPTDTPRPTRTATAEPTATTPPSPTATPSPQPTATASARPTESQTLQESDSEGGEQSGNEPSAGDTAPTIAPSDGAARGVGGPGRRRRRPNRSGRGTRKRSRANRTCPKTMPRWRCPLQPRIGREGINAATARFLAGPGPHSTAPKAATTGPRSPLPSTWRRAETPSSPSSASTTNGAATTRSRSTVNGVEVFAGPSPFPAWDGVGNGENAQWGELRLSIPAGTLVAGANEIVVANLVDSANVGLPPYVLLSDATLSTG